MTCALQGQVSIWARRCGRRGAGGREEPCPRASQEARAEHSLLPHAPVQGHEEQCCLETPAPAWVPAVASSHGRCLSCCTAWHGTKLGGAVTSALCPCMPPGGKRSFFPSGNTCWQKWVISPNPSLAPRATEASKGLRLSTGFGCCVGHVSLTKHHKSLC